MVGTASAIGYTPPDWIATAGRHGFVSWAARKRIAVVPQPNYARNTGSLSVRNRPMLGNSMNDHPTEDRRIGLVVGRFSATLLALDEFYSLKDAIAWCESPQPLLGGKRPLELLLTDEGSQQVAAVIARLQDGAFI